MPSLSLPRPPPTAGDVAHGAPPPPPPHQDGVLAPRRAAPRRDPPRRAPVREEGSCQEVPRPQENAPALPEPLRQDCAPPVVAVRGHQGLAPHQQRVPVATADCRAFTPELCSVAWPGKFKLDLPPRYDGTPDPAEFLQLYELSIEAANGDEKVMANWFPMALKDGARSWLLNLPLGSISSWNKICNRFVTNFQGTRDRLRPQVTCAASSSNLERPCRSTSSASTAFVSRSPR